MLIPKLVAQIFPYGESPNGNFFASLPDSIWGSPYGNGDPHMVIITIWGFFLGSPNGNESPYGNGLVTELSPYGNGYPLPYGDPHMVTGSSDSSSPYGNGDPHMETGMHSGFSDPRYHTGIPIW